MRVDDLHEYPVGTSPSPYPPLAFDSFTYSSKVRHGKLPASLSPTDICVLHLPPGLSLFAIGWLGSDVPSVGATLPRCVDRLFESYERDRIFADDTRGYHDREVCGRPEPGDLGYTFHWAGRELTVVGSGHHLVQTTSSVYMCPALILHYILDHGYRPPEEFVQAVMKGAFLTIDDLEVTTMPSSEFERRYP